MTRTTNYDSAVAAQRRPGPEHRDGTLDLRELVRLATLAASSHNTQPWRFRLEGRSITILPDLSRRCLVVDPDDGHLYKSLGCAAENLVHAAAAQGHAAHVSFDQAENAVRIILEPSSAVRPGALFQAITKRQCTKLPYDGRAIPADERTALEEAGRGDGGRVMLIDDPRTREAIVDSVRQGDVTQLSDPAFRRELIHWLRFNDAAAIRTGDGLAGRTVGQPALPDWLAKLIIGFVLTGRGQADTDERNIRSSPLIAVFASRRDDPEGWIETGRAYERFALQATALGIRNAFINQPIEVRKLRPQLDGLLGLTGETALLMVRVGYGPEAQFSLRRAVEDVIIEG
jgi:hypothetical protein